MKEVVYLNCEQLSSRTIFFTVLPVAAVHGMTQALCTQGLYSI